MPRKKTAKKKVAKKKTTRKKTAPAAPVEMMSLKSKRTDPPGGWVYVCEDGFPLRGRYYEELVRLVRHHMSKNEQPIPADIEAHIQHQICSRIPESMCNGDGPARFFPSLQKLITGTRKVVNTFRKSGEKKIDGQDMDRRLQCCVSCVMNHNRAGCFRCEEPYKLSAGAFGQLPKNIGQNLAACDFFEATGYSLVSTPESILASLFKKKDLEYCPPKCWIKPIIEAAREKDNAD